MNIYFVIVYIYNFKVHNSQFGGKYVLSLMQEIWIMKIYQNINTS